MGVVAPSLASRRIILAGAAARGGWHADEKALDLLSADLEATAAELVGTLATLAAHAKHDRKKLDVTRQELRAYLDRKKKVDQELVSVVGDLSRWTDGRPRM